MIERYNRTVKNILSMNVQSDQTDWDLYLPVPMAYMFSKPLVWLQTIYC